MDTIALYYKVDKYLLKKKTAKHTYIESIKFVKQANMI